MTTEDHQDPLAAISAGALEPMSDLTTVLRQCLALGTETGSQRLREWASRELLGYGSDDELPPYRVTHAALFMDGQTLFGRISRQQVPAIVLPDIARDLPSRDIELREPLATLLGLRETAQQAEDGAVLVLPPGVEALVPLMNHQLATGAVGAAPSQRIDRVYWAVPFSVFAGVADSVRTILVQLVSELRTRMPANDTLPSPEIADQAVNVVVHGDNNQVVVGQAAPNSTAVVGGTSANFGTSESRAKTFAWWVFGIIASASAIATIIALFHH